MSNQLKMQDSDLTSESHPAFTAAKGFDVGHRRYRGRTGLRWFTAVIGYRRYRSRTDSRTGQKFTAGIEFRRHRGRLEVVYSLYWKQA